MEPASTNAEDDRERPRVRRMDPAIEITRIINALVDEVNSLRDEVACLRTSKADGAAVAHLREEVEANRVRVEGIMTAAAFAQLRDEVIHRSDRTEGTPTAGALAELREEVATARARIDSILADTATTRMATVKSDRSGDEAAAARSTNGEIDHRLAAAELTHLRNELGTLKGVPTAAAFDQLRTELRDKVAAARARVDGMPTAQAFAQMAAALIQLGEKASAAKARMEGMPTAAAYVQLTEGVALNRQQVAAAKARLDRLENVPTASDFEQLGEEVAAAKAQADTAKAQADAAKAQAAAARARADDAPTAAMFDHLRTQVAAARVRADDAPTVATFDHLREEVAEVKTRVGEVPTANAFARLKDIVRASVPRLDEHWMLTRTERTEYVECCSWSFEPPLSNQRLIAEAAVLGSVSALEMGLPSVYFALKLTVGDDGSATSESLREVGGEVDTWQAVSLMVEHLSQGREKVWVRLWCRANPFGACARIYGVQLKTSWHPSEKEVFP